MGSILDTIMLILFFLFMVFIFGGYHKNKSAQREAQRKREEQNLQEQNGKNTKD
jgi:uncharacterized membrane protein